MSALHSGDMAKVYALLSALESNTPVRNIVHEDVKRASETKAMGRLNLRTMKFSDIRLDMIRDYEFEFDHARETAGTPGRASHDLVDDSLYTNTLFEFRITPILYSALRSMIHDGFGDEPAMVKDYIMVASAGYYTEELRRWRADGKLTDNECDELFQYIVDDMLTPDEIAELQQKANDNILSYDAVEFLLTATLTGKVYRMSCWIIYGKAKINVTTLMEDMISLWRADELYDNALATLSRTSDANVFAAHDAVMDEMEASYKLLTVDNDGNYVKKYTPGDHTDLLSVESICAMPEPSDAFYPQINDRWFDALTVDVRKEDKVFSTTREFWYRAYITDNMTQMPDHHYLIAPNHTNGLAALVYAK